ncbi:TraM recognition domain-containing protein (plasmid) [Pseudomonas sp. G.S.17]|uniref:TraM recognition domain-containing protein n=1 Tax=Pseudomonas sp. G.S.17 TaxID=3137451 RepID=UPI00311CDE29
MEILRFILLNTNPGLTALFSLLIGILLVLSVTGAVRETDETTALEVFLVWLRRSIVILLTVSLPMFIAGLYVYSYVVYNKDWSAANQFMDLWFGEFKAAVSDLWWSLLVVLALPMFIRTLMLRFVRPALSNWARKFRVKQSGDALSDIRVEVGKIKAKDFDPRSFYLPGQMFLGLDEHGEPIHMDDETFLKNHKKVIGPSQTGKGVVLGVLLDQAIMKGWGAWFIDQKPDDFICDIMGESCERYKRPAPKYLDLNGVGPGAYAPFAHGTRRERRERVVKAYGMADSGTGADYYKRIERKILDFIMPYWDGSLRHLDKLLRGAHPEITDAKRSWITANSGSLDSNTSEFMQLETLLATPEESFNVSDALLGADVVYVRSHMKDTIVRKACIALIDEIVQVTLRNKLPTPVFIVLDEIKFIVSDTLADALATLLSKGVNMALTYQAITDLLNLPDKSLNADSIRGGIDTNTQVTMSYRANDFETAEWVSDQTGKGQKTVTKMEKVDVNKAGAEVWGEERSVGQVEENYITTNQLLALPPRVSALIRPNKLSTLLYTCWIPVENPKGMPGRNEVIPQTPKPVALVANATDTTVVEEDPFALNETATDDEDPFAAMNEPDATEDPFNAGNEPEASIESFASTNDDGEEVDPFEHAVANAKDDDFSTIELDDQGEDPFAAMATVSPEPAVTGKGSKGKKGALSAEEQEKIQQALSGILKSPASKPKESEGQNKAKTAVDLSSIDNIEGI